MNNKSPYLIDSSVFIDAKNRYYAFSICPGFWDSLIGYHKNEDIYSIEHIRQELLRGEDELATWVKKKLPKSFFLQTSEEGVRTKYREIMTWGQRNPQFFDAAKAEFATEADGWLAAYAKVHDCIVVTGEQFRPEAKNKVHLPNVCESFEVKYLDIFEMLKNLKIKFEWKK